MNAFTTNMAFEAEFTTRLVAALQPLFETTGRLLVRHAREGQSSKQSLDVDMQRAIGDFTLMEKSTGMFVSQIDLKVERKVFRNLFFEEFSNDVCDPTRVKLGWGRTIKVDRLWYAFAPIQAVALLDLAALRAWLDEVIPAGGNRKKLRKMDYPEKLQDVHVQLNKTTGRPIPFRDIPQAVWKGAYVMDDATVRITGRDEFLSLVETAMSVRQSRA